MAAISAYERSEMMRLHDDLKSGDVTELDTESVCIVISALQIAIDSAPLSDTHRAERL